MNSIVLQKLDRLNKGFNFFNFTQTEKKYYIKVNLVVKQNLEEREETLEVDTNIYSNGYYYREYDVEKFLKDLEDFCSKPLAEVIRTNKKERGYGYYGSGIDLREIENEIRDKTIKFSDIKIEIGELARQKLKELNIDFENRVKDLLSKQKSISKDKQIKINRYVFLREHLKMLKSLITEESNYYSYNKPKDNSLKIMLNPNEYNDRLKEVEKELRILEKSLEITPYKIEYIVIKEEMTYEKWLKENEEQLRGEFQESECEIPFEEWAEMTYENSENDEQEFDDEEDEEE